MDFDAMHKEAGVLPFIYTNSIQTTIGLLFLLIN